MTVPAWEPGRLYQPGSLVRPRSGDIVFQEQPDNPIFADGLQDWTELDSEGGVAGWSLSTVRAFQGIQSARWIGATGTLQPRNHILGKLLNDNAVPVTPGQRINFSGRIARETQPNNNSWNNAGIRVYWYNASDQLISISAGNTVGVSDTPAGMVGGSGNGSWIQQTGSATAPANAAFARFAFHATGNGVSAGAWVDLASWDYTFAGPPEDLIFRAVQPESGFSASSEPAWPGAVGNTVVDNEVIWEAVLTQRVVYEARPILVSGTSEPDFPTEPGGTVPDGTISWRATSRRITDPRLPQTKTVAIASSKIFAADGDIIAYSATVNPLDWSSRDDAGFLPFGLQLYGGTEIQALGLYRGNLVAFNSEGFQVWQTDEDPTNMALLDAQPIPATFPRGVQAVGDELLMLNRIGVRSVSVAGGNTSLRAGDVGKVVDVLVQALIASGEEPIALYAPGLGQYWLIVGDEALVYTMHSLRERRGWSRYTFPSEITDWTILGDRLYLRSGAKVWRVDDDALEDDEHDDGGEPAGVPFDSVIQWPYLDLGEPGRDKGMVGFDVVGDGDEVEVQVGWDQVGQNAFTPPYAIPADTLTGQLIPMPVSGPTFSLRLTWRGPQRWSVRAATIYLQDYRRGA